MGLWPPCLSHSGCYPEFRKCFVKVKLHGSSPCGLNWNLTLRCCGSSIRDNHGRTPRAGTTLRHGLQFMKWVHLVGLSDRQESLGIYVSYMQDLNTGVQCGGEELYSSEVRH